MLKKNLVCKNLLSLKKNYTYIEPYEVEILKIYNVKIMV